MDPDTRCATVSGTTTWIPASSADDQTLAFLLNGNRIYPGWLDRLLTRCLGSRFCTYVYRENADCHPAWESRSFFHGNAMAYHRHMLRFVNSVYTEPTRN